MTDLWRWSGDGVAGVHFAYLAYLIVGGFVAWRWPKTVVAHAVAAFWAVLIVATPVPCPLTSLQEEFRRLAGQAPLPRIRGRLHQGQAVSRRPQRIGPDSGRRSRRGSWLQVWPRDAIGALDATPADMCGICIQAAAVPLGNATRGPRYQRANRPVGRGVRTGGGRLARTPLTPTVT